MQYVRRFIAIISGIAAWCIATTTTAYALIPDPADSGGGVASTPTPAGTPLWQVLAYWAFGILLAVAIVGLGYSLSHSRRSAASTRSRA